MAMFVESFLNINDSKAFSYKHVPYKNRALFAKINFLTFREFRPKQVPVKIDIPEQ